MTAPRGLHALARLHGIQTAYHDHAGKRITASPEALMATLRALGVELADAEGIGRQLRVRRRVLAERALEPVVVVWADGSEAEAEGKCRLRTPAWRADPVVRVVIALEQGGERTAVHERGTLDSADGSHGDGVIDRVLPLPAVPTGYHRLRVEMGDGRSASRHEALLVAAPGRAAPWDVLPGPRRPWGVFAPLYGLWSADRGRDGPDYRLLERLAEETASAGGSVVGTLPLLAAFLDRPYEPSPYAPVSRLFWNAAYVEAPRRAPRRPSRHGGPGGHGGHGSDGAGSPMADMDAPAPGIDLRTLWARRRPVLESEASALWAEAGAAEAEGTGPGTPPALKSFLARNPRAEDYARFRAITEARGPWDGWPARLRARDVRPGDFDRDVARTHLYAQWRAERELAEISERAAGLGVSLYLDLPLGVHRAGYDTWRERESFVLEVSAGAPPDPLARGGQDWGFPPLHPEATRLQGHRYFVASIRKHLRYARVLRIDHIMQLHRMFWVPASDPRQGVYVRYPAEELYAILCLESRRAGAVIVGEDLGTVPRATRRSMKRHGVPGMYVAQFELRTTNHEHPTTNDERRTVDNERRVSREALVPRKVGEGALASIGTHDTPTFAGWWFGEDARIRLELGQVDEAEARREVEGRAELRDKLARGLGVEAGDDGRALALRVEEALLRRLGGSKAGLVLATMEDLWLERQPQNVPGTASERNWSRRLGRPLEALSEPAIARLLDALDRARNEPRGEEP